MNVKWSTFVTGLTLAVFVTVLLGANFRSAAEDQTTEVAKPVLLLKYGDGKANGKKSLGGTGEMIRFELPDTQQKVKALRIHAARYGTPQAPDEDVDITFVSDDETEIIDNQTVPYARFRRGQSRWVTLKFDEPVEVPETFWVIFDFGAERTKGVYVSYDTATGGKHSRIGLPGADSREVDFGGDWMVQLILTKPE